MVIKKLILLASLIAVGIYTPAPLFAARPQGAQQAFIAAFLAQVPAPQPPAPPVPHIPIPISKSRLAGSALGFIAGGSIFATYGMRLGMYSTGVCFYQNDGKISSFIQHMQDRLPHLEWLNSFEKLTPEQRNEEYQKLSAYYEHRLSILSQWDQFWYRGSTPSQPLVALAGDLKTYHSLLTLYGNNIWLQQFKSCDNHSLFDNACNQCIEHKAHAQALLAPLEALHKIVVASPEYKKQLTQARWENIPINLFGMGVGIALMAACEIVFLNTLLR